MIINKKLVDDILKNEVKISVSEYDIKTRSKTIVWEFKVSDSNLIVPKEKIGNTIDEVIECK